MAACVRCGGVLLVVMLALSSLALAEVPPPRPVQATVKLGSYYFPGHFHAGRWAPMKAYGHPKPLLGYYRDGAPGVMDWHIKWAVEHGISYFVFDWYYDYHTGRVPEHDRALDEGFLKARYRNLMEFAVFWCNEEGGDEPPYTEDQLLTLARLLGQRYLKQPNYLRIDGRPVVFVSEPMRLWQSFGLRFRQLLPRLSRAAGLPDGTDLYLVGKQSEELDRLAGMGFSACTAYNYAGVRLTDTASPLRATYDEMVEAYEAMWRRVKAESQIPYIVPVSPGWDSRPWYGPRAFVRSGATPAKFRDMCERAKRYVDPKLKLVISECWNEFGEGSFIEPTEEQGFGALDALRTAFCRPGNWPPDAIPSAADRAAWVWSPEQIPDDPLRAAPTTASGNLLVGGDMEEGADSWLTFDHGPATFLAAQPHSGRRCLAVRPGLGAKASTPVSFVFGRAYEVAAWLRCSPGASVRVTCALFGPDGRWLKSYHDVGQSRSREWAEVKAIVPATDPGVGGIDVEFVATGGTCYADDAGVRVFGEALGLTRAFEDSGASPDAWTLYDGQRPTIADGALLVPKGTGIKTKQTFPAGPSTVYGLSAWIRCDDKASLRITAAEFDANGDWLSSYAPGTVVSWQDWIQVTCAIRFPEGTKARLCDLEFVALGGDAWVRDVRLTEGRKLAGP
jgi:Glycosyltransferase WbsX